MAAVLACGPDALLSHRSCAALASIRGTSLSYVEVTVPTYRGKIDGVRPYVSRRLQPQDREEIDGIPCTSLALTLLQLAVVLPRRGLERACDEALVQELFDLSRMRVGQLSLECAEVDLVDVARQTFLGFEEASPAPAAWRRSARRAPLWAAGIAAASSG